MDVPCISSRRFNFAIPVYGGVSIDKSVSSFWNLYYQDMSQEYIDNYYAEMVARWDNLDGLKNTDCKVYYITSTTDFAFSMDIASRCAEAANGYCNFKVGYNHNNTGTKTTVTIAALKVPILFSLAVPAANTKSMFTPMIRTIPRIAKICFAFFWCII